VVGMVAEEMAVVAQGPRQADKEVGMVAVETAVVAQGPRRVDREVVEVVEMVEVEQEA
jgi:hypothetical protein